MPFMSALLGDFLGGPGGFNETATRLRKENTDAYETERSHDETLAAALLSHPDLKPEYKAAALTAMTARGDKTSGLEKWFGKHQKHPMFPVMQSLVGMSTEGTEEQSGASGSAPSMFYTPEERAQQRTQQIERDAAAKDTGERTSRLKGLADLYGKDSPEYKRNALLTDPHLHPAALTPHFAGTVHSSRMSAQDKALYREQAGVDPDPLATYRRSRNTMGDTTFDPVEDPPALRPRVVTGRNEQGEPIRVAIFQPGTGPTPDSDVPYAHPIRGSELAVADKYFVTPGEHGEVNLTTQPQGFQRPGANVPPPTVSAGGGVTVVPSTSTAPPSVTAPPMRTPSGARTQRVGDKTVETRPQEGAVLNPDGTISEVTADFDAIHKIAYDPRQPDQPLQGFIPGKPAQGLLQEYEQVRETYRQAVEARAALEAAGLHTNDNPQKMLALWKQYYSGHAGTDTDPTNIAVRNSLAGLSSARALITGRQAVQIFQKALVHTPTAPTPLEAGWSGVPGVGKLVNPTMVGLVGQQSYDSGKAAYTKLGDLVDVLKARQQEILTTLGKVPDRATGTPRTSPPPPSARTPTPPPSVTETPPPAPVRSNAAGTGYIEARDPQGVVHHARAGTVLPAGWILVK
jgi:hypothetical protein